MFVHAALTLFAILADTAASPMQDPAEMADVKLLQDARLGTDGPSLLAFFRRRTLSAKDEQRLGQLVQQLGSARFAAREKASRELPTYGMSALRMLRGALASPDKEVARRAAACITEIEGGAGPALPAAAAGLLVRRAPTGAIATLLAFLPFAGDPLVEEDVLGALTALGTLPGKADPALTAALKDPVPLRRAAGAHVLGRHSDRALRERVSKLLGDEAPVVRLRAAQGLVAGKEREAVPVLIALLDGAPADVARQAEELLWRLGAERSPGPPADDSPAARRNYRDAWARWWRDHARDVDLARLAEQPPHLGLTIIANANRVWECHRDGKPRWTIGGLQNPIEALMLPGNRVLIVENTGARVTERDLQGKILWDHKTPHQALSARWQPNGRLFVVTNSTVSEITRDGRDVYRHRFPAPGTGGSRINSACKLRNGRLLVLTDAGTMTEVEAMTGKILSTRPAPDGACYSVEPLPGNGWLVAGYGSGKVVEFDAAGKSIWEYTLPSAFHASRLPNGHTLIASHGGKRVIEVTRVGKIVWEHQMNEYVWRAHRR